MKDLKTCPTPIELNRRNFLARALAAGAAGTAALSFEEQALQAAQPAPQVQPGKKMSTGKIKDVEISRLICGGNLIGGYAHSRDLIYVSGLLKQYFTDEKILDTWQICETNGINCMNIDPSPQAVALFKRYRKERGGKMKWLAQTPADSDNMPTLIKQVIDDGATGVYLLGNRADQWTFEKRVDLIGRFVDLVNKEGVISGVAGHSLDMVQAVEAAGIKNDFYMKTLHNTNYWSKRQPDQTKQVIENYSVDNYWDMEPDKTIAFMQKVKKPWIAYKVLAAGAIRPQIGFDYAFANGADFACVGMFDFQVAEDVKIAEEVLARYEERRREWFS